MNYWLHNKREKGYFCKATVYPYEGDISGLVSFDIEELNFDMPEMWKFLKLKPGRRYSVGIGAFHFLDSNYDPKAGDKIKIGLVAHEDQGSCPNSPRTRMRYIAKKVGKNE